MLAAGAGDLASVSDEELKALSLEVSELLIFANDDDCREDDVLGAADETDVEDTVAANTTAVVEDMNDVDTEDIVADQPNKTTPRVLDACMSELRRHTETLLKKWESPEWTESHDASPALDETRKTLALIDFYAAALKRIIDVTSRCGEAAMIDSLKPIHLALEDGSCFHLLCSPYWHPP